MLYNTFREQTREGILPHSQTPRKKLQCDVQRIIFHERRGVRKWDETLSRVLIFLIKTRTKEKADN